MEQRAGSRQVNCLRHNDIVEVNPYWPSDYPDTHWLGRIKAFRKSYGRESVLVEALDLSDDPMVENEMPFSFRALTFKERP